MAPPQSDEIASRGENQESSSKPVLPFLSLIPKFPFGFSKKGGEGGRVDVVIKEETAGEQKVGEVEESGNPAKSDVVKFQLKKPEVEPLKLESEDAEQNTNPLVLWQVYALGGFILVKWAWAKWQERKANAKKGDSAEDKGDSAEDPSPETEDE